MGNNNVSVIKLIANIRQDKNNCVKANEYFRWDVQEISRHAGINYLPRCWTIPTISFIGDVLKMLFSNVGFVR